MLSLLIQLPSFAMTCFDYYEYHEAQAHENYAVCSAISGVSFGYAFIESSACADSYYASQGSNVTNLNTCCNTMPNLC